MRAPRTVATLWAMTLVVAAVTTPMLGPAAAIKPGPALPADGTLLAADSTAIRIAVRPDGSADWTVQYRVELDDAETASSFERVSRRVEADPLNYTGPFAEQMGEAASLAAEDTGRAMAVRNVTVRARTLPTRQGVVTYRFEWTAFAATSGGRLVIGDALVGLALPSERTTLVIQWPRGYDPRRVSPEPDETRDRAAVWRGPVEFAPDEPRVVVAGGGPLPVDPSRAAAVAVVAVVVAAVGWRLRRKTSVLLGGGGPEDAATGAGGSGDVPEELLSDAERVVNLVEANGGRMKQQAVVASLDWSETKTSQVVNELAEEGELEIYNIGRENVLSLPGEMAV